MNIDRSYKTKKVLSQCSFISERICKLIISMRFNVYYHCSVEILKSPKLNSAKRTSITINPTTTTYLELFAIYLNRK